MGAIGIDRAGRDKGCVSRLSGILVLVSQIYLRYKDSGNSQNKTPDKLNKC